MVVVMVAVLLMAVDGPTRQIFPEIVQHRVFQIEQLLHREHLLTPLRAEEVEIMFQPQVVVVCPHLPVETIKEHLFALKQIIIVQERLVVLSHQIKIVVGNLLSSTTEEHQPEHPTTLIPTGVAAVVHQIAV